MWGFNQQRYHRSDMGIFTQAASLVPEVRYGGTETAILSTWMGEMIRFYFFCSHTSLYGHFLSIRFSYHRRINLNSVSPRTSIILLITRHHNPYLSQRQNSGGLSQLLQVLRESPGIPLCRIENTLAIRPITGMLCVYYDETC